MFIIFINVNCIHNWFLLFFEADILHWWRGYSRSVWQFYIEIWHSKHTFFSTYNFIRVPRSKNLFCNILERSRFRDFDCILRFSWYFVRCSWFFGGYSGFSVPGFLGVIRVFWGVFRVLGGVPGFLGVPRSSGIRVFRCSWKYYMPTSHKCGPAKITKRKKNCKLRKSNLKYNDTEKNLSLERLCCGSILSLV